MKQQRYFWNRSFVSTDSLRTVSDRGPQFTSQFAFCGSNINVINVTKINVNINVSLTSGYHPQSNGQVERLNQELTQFLRSYCHLNQKDWSHFLLWTEYAQSSLHKPSTGLTPFQCVLGFQPPLFPWSGEPSELPAINDWLQSSGEIWNTAHVHLQRAIRRVKEQADHHRRSGPAYTPGQWIWLSTRNLHLRLPCKKLNPKYAGPFKIIRQTTPVSYCLALPSNYRISPTFHVSLLKPPVVREERGTRRRPLTRAPLPSSWMARCTRCRKSWTPDTGAGFFNTSSTGRVMVLRKDLGSMLRISWTLHSQLNSIEPTLKNQPLAPVKGLGIMYLLASGAARREGALSQIRPLWLSPIATRGHPLLGTSFHGLPFPIHPVPGNDYWHRCFPLASSYKLHLDS